MKLTPQLPTTVADQIMLCLALTLFSCTITMISLVIQEKPIPPDFKEFSERIAIGVLGGFGFNKLTK